MLCRAYDVPWPLPERAPPRVVPRWSVADDEAELVRLPLPDYLTWSATGAGRWWLERLRLKWRIRAEWETRERERATAEAEDAAYARQGWHGGRTAPVGTARDS